MQEFIVAKYSCWLDKYGEIEDIATSPYLTEVFETTERYLFDCVQDFLDIYGIHLYNFNWNTLYEDILKKKILISGEPKPKKWGYLVIYTKAEAQEADWGPITDFKDSVILSEHAVEYTGASGSILVVETPDKKIKIHTSVTKEMVRKIIEDYLHKEITDFNLDEYLKYGIEHWIEIDNFRFNYGGLNLNAG